MDAGLSLTSLPCFLYPDLVPRKGLEPPRSYPLVPETSASTNSATWAFQEVLDYIIKTTSFKNPTTPVGAELMSEVEGTVQGHRDGHGFVVRDDRQADLYLSQQEMRAVLHHDRVKARVIRYDRKGRPEGRVLEILERKKSPIIGRLLHESGVWLVAPEDKRYGQDILIPKNATANAAVGQVVAIDEAVAVTVPLHRAFHFAHQLCADGGYGIFE